jgi:cold shock CspA family protein/ribosome-associated translation inhibitor RaiA
MEIHWRGAKDFGESDRRAAEDRLLALARDHTDLIDVRIDARVTAHHRHGGQEVRIAGAALGQRIIAARTRPDASLALREAIDAFEREVWRMRHRRTQRREERAAPPPELGVVDRVFGDRGYGFILTDRGERVYFHRNALHGGIEFKSLTEGQRVGLNVEGGAAGLQATAVTPAPPDAPAP